jgi:hypothetical protein
MRVVCADGSIKESSTLFPGDSLLSPDIHQKSINPITIQRINTTSSGNNAGMWYVVKTKDISFHRETHAGTVLPPTISLHLSFKPHTLYKDDWSKHVCPYVHIVSCDNTTCQEVLTIRVCVHTLMTIIKPKIHPKSYHNLLYMAHTTYPIEFVPMIDYTSNNIDPYIIGLWLGDGHSNAPTITTADDEIVRHMKTLLEQHDMVLIQSTYTPIRYYIRGRQRGNNPFLRFLRQHDMYKNKHIPDCILRGSITTRRGCLAGLLDADGTLVRGMYYDIVQKNTRLAEGIAFLARSLGFRVSVSESIQSTVYLGKRGHASTYWRMSIKGIQAATHLPMILHRKRVCPTTTMTKTIHAPGIPIEIVEIRSNHPCTLFSLNPDTRAPYLLENFGIVSHDNSHPHPFSRGG